MAKTQILGTVSVVPMGDWNSTTTYQKGNYVRYNKATYMAKVANVNVTPGVSTNWQQIWMLCNYDGVAEIASETPLPDTENGAVGQSTAYAREDHQHKMSAIYESASAANTKWQAQGQVNETIFNTIEDVSTSLAGVIGEALSDIPLAPEQTGVAITGENTLAGASVSVKLASKNLANEEALISSGLVERTTFQGRNCLKIIAANFVDVTITLPPAPNICGVNWAIDADSTNPQMSILQLNQTYQDGTQKTNYIGQNEKAINTWYENDQAGLPYKNLTSLAIRTTDNMPSGGGVYIQITANLGDELSDYTPYIADGTSVNVTACGGNIYNGETPPSGSNGSFSEDGYTFTRTTTGQTSNISFGIGKIYAATQGRYVTFSCNVDSENPDIGIQYSYGDLQETVNGKFIGDRWVVTAYIKYGTTPINHWRVFIGGTDEQTKVLSNICINIGDTPIPFETYNGITQSATVGQLLQVDQYDKITTVFADNIGVTVSAAFKQSTRYELDDRLVPLFGAFANRPTDIQPFARLYVATDQTGDNKVTILPANTDGSVSENWITI